jgi:hypothetical protein
LQFLLLLSFAAFFVSCTPQRSKATPSSPPICPVRGEDPTITRANAAQILAPKIANRFQGLNFSPPKRVLPSDVPETHPAYADIQTAIEQKWMSPNAQGKFLPNSTITWEEGLAILVQSSGVPKLSPNAQKKILSRHLKAQSVKEWAKPNLAVALDRGLANSKSGIRLGEHMRLSDFCYGVAQLEKVKSLPPQPSESPPRFRWEILGAIAVGSVGVFLLSRKISTPAQLTLVSTLEAVKCLQITEQRVSGSGQSTTLVDKAKVFLFPASFGDQNSMYVIQSCKVEGKLFEIARSSDGSLFLTPNPQKTLLCNGVSVAQAGMKLENHVSSTIEYQQSRWHLQPLFDMPQRKPNSAYFAQLNSRE